MNPTPRAETPPVMPWWRYGMVWLVIGGPVSAVIAGLATVWIAAHNADVEIMDPPAVRAAGTVAPKTTGTAVAPAAAVDR
jgi:hypothetical protein